MPNQTSIMSWAFDVAARTLAQEVRGEPLVGQQSVAYVIKNRLASKRWGNSLATVCLWPYQFSGWRGPQDPNFTYACTLPDNDATLDHMRSVLQVALDSLADPTGGATHYYNSSIVIQPPAWVQGATLCGQFGNQLFYKGVK